MKIKTTLFAMALFVGLASCEDILEVPDISDQTVMILAPIEGSVLEVNAVNFNWEPVGEATGYQIQIATPNFGNATQLILDSIVEVDTLGYLTTRIGQSLFNGNYEWRIKAFNSNYETPYTMNAFQVNGDEDQDLPPPNNLLLVSPGNESNASNTFNTTVTN